MMIGEMVPVLLLTVQMVISSTSRLMKNDYLEAAPPFLLLTYLKLDCDIMSVVVLCG